MTGGLAPALAALDALLDAAVAAARPADPHRALYVADDEARTLLARQPLELARPSAPPAQDAPLLRRAADVLGLDAFAEWVVLLALAAELDLRYERIFGYLQDDATRRRPTVSLALDLLCADPDERLRRLQDLGPGAPLLHGRALQLHPDPHDVEPPLLARYLVLEPGLLRFLLGAPEPALARPTATLDDAPVGEAERIALAGLARSGGPLRLVVHGRPGSGRAATAAAVAAARGMPVLRAAAADEEVLALAARDARLHGALLCVECADDEATAAALRLLRDEPAAVVVAESSPARPGWPAVRAAEPGYEERQALWQAEGVPTAAAARLAGTFRLTRGRIADAVALARDRARVRAAPAPTLDDLLAAAHDLTRGELPLQARLLEPRYGWDDIVLPDETVEQLRALCARAVHRHLVYDRWGFVATASRGGGVNALFAGPPGTGKTMAAEVVARELGLELYAIDLSQVVSKYIGETEKNLHRIFEAARAASAILFFDEADALFGKRSEVKDAHDRYANVEVAYLLQKLEEHDGLVLLASNLRHNIDEAFARRLDLVLEFPLPDEEHRRRIWQRVFPAAAPLADDVDPAALARELDVPGGSIRTIALDAAFAAAADGGVITGALLRRAARREYRKLGRTWQEPAWR